MTAIDLKVLELTRDRSNKSCRTCRHNEGRGCAVVGDRKQCIYQDMIYWQPNKSLFYRMAENILEEE